MDSPDRDADALREAEGRRDAIARPNGSPVMALERVPFDIQRGE
jgi:hypothetical protein